MHLYYSRETCFQYNLSYRSDFVGKPKEDSTPRSSVPSSWIPEMTEKLCVCSRGGSLVAGCCWLKKQGKPSTSSGYHVSPGPGPHRGFAGTRMLPPVDRDGKEGRESQCPSTWRRRDARVYHLRRARPLEEKSWNKNNSTLDGVCCLSQGTSPTEN